MGALREALLSAFFSTYLSTYLSSSLLLPSLAIFIDRFPPCLLSGCIYIEKKKKKKKTCPYLFSPLLLPFSYRFFFFVFFFLPDFPFRLSLIRSMCYILDRWKTKHSRQSFRLIFLLLSCTRFFAVTEYFLVGSFPFSYACRYRKPNDYLRLSTYHNEPQPKSN